MCDSKHWRSLFLSPMPAGAGQDALWRNINKLEMFCVISTIGMSIAHNAGTVLQIMISEGQMESAINETSYSIRYEKETFHAAVCQRCGARMFPAELLEAHMDRHELKDMYLQGELKKLQFAMNRMR
jgi:ribosomal protein S27AE